MDSYTVQWANSGQWEGRHEGGLWTSTAVIVQQIVSERAGMTAEGLKHLHFSRQLMVNGRAGVREEGPQTSTAV